MSRKIFNIIIIIFIVIAIGVWAFFYFSSKQEAKKQGEDLTFREFFPFGQRESIDFPLLIDLEKTPAPTENPIDDKTEMVKEKLRKISSFPVSGATVVSKTKVEEKGNENGEIIKEEKIVSVARYMEKSTGHLYEMFLDTNEEVKIANTTIPGVNEALFNSDGNSVVLRYLKYDSLNPSLVSIETFSGKIVDDEGNSIKQLRGDFLSQGIEALVLSPNKNNIFYLSNLGEEVVGLTSEVDNSNKKQIFNSQFTEWLPQWATNEKIILTTKPSAKVSGFAYGLNIKTKSFDKILDKVFGLTTLMSPDGKKILYNNSTEGGFNLNTYLTDTNEKVVVELSTLPEKCLWSSLQNNVVFCAVPKYIEAGDYPDIWYQGLFSFSDDLWKLDLETGIFTVLVNPTESLGVEIDAIKLFLDKDENNLFFINKKDQSLWTFDLN